MWESVSRSALSRLSTDLLAIHVRHATLPANQGLHFTHPLHRDGDVGPWYFMHNGFLPTVHQLLGQDRSRFDSAEYFDYVIPPGATALNSDETLSRLNDISPGGSSGNAIAITSERAYVIHWSPSDTPYRRYFTMHKLTGPDFIVIASEIIPSLAATEHWEPLTPQHIVEIPLTASTKGHPS